MTKALVIFGVLAIVIIGITLFILKEQNTKTPPQIEDPKKAETTPQTEPESMFDNPKKSAHYESNTPAHGQTLAGVPVNVVIDFNFDLAENSTISIMGDGIEYGTGKTVVDKNKLSMRRLMDPKAPDGFYTVKYNACWPDKTCHDGKFQFYIDRGKADSFTDGTNKKEVTVRLSGLSFKPVDLKISKGTKVTWINDEDIEHYVNTDSHPAHTYYPPQNSRVLKKGEGYSLTFDTPGIYPYHCSAHAAQMKANILVE